VVEESLFKAAWEERIRYGSNPLTVIVLAKAATRIRKELPFASTGLMGRAAQFMRRTIE
jgi:hypothetical protein